MEIKNFRETLKEAMREKGISGQKLSELTGIAPGHIKALLENDIQSLPSSPYVRGYIDTIAEILEIDPRVLWDDYNRLAEIKSSGAKDLLPSNRFAPKVISKKSVVIAIIILIALAYLTPKIADFLGKPSLEIYSPSQDKLVVEDAKLNLRGKVGNPQDKILINNAEVVVMPDGTFEQEVVLEDGPQNTFEFIAKRFLGRETSITRTVIYKAPITDTETPPSEEASTTPEE